MPSLFQLPTPESFGEVLTSLVGKEVRCATVEESAAGKGVQAAGTYTREEELGAVAVGDVAFVALASAALSLAPVARAEDAIRLGEIDEDLSGDAREILNVCGSVFNSSDEMPCRLSDVAFEEPPYSGDVAKLVGAAKTTLHLEVEIDGYGKGALSIYLA